MPRFGIAAAVMLAVVANAADAVETIACPTDSGVPAGVAERLDTLLAAAVDAEGPLGVAFGAAPGAVLTLEAPGWIYARAAAWILGADRVDERMWRQLEKQAGVETAVTAQTAETEKSTEPQAGRISALRRRGWKISTPKYME